MTYSAFVCRIRHNIQNSSKSSIDNFSSLCYLLNNTYPNWYLKFIFICDQTNIGATPYSDLFVITPYKNIYISLVGNVERRVVEEVEWEERKLAVWRIERGECPFYSSEARLWCCGEVSHGDASTGAQSGGRWCRRVGEVSAVMPGVIAVKMRPWRGRASDLSVAGTGGGHRLQRSREQVSVSWRLLVAWRCCWRAERARGGRGWRAAVTLWRVVDVTRCPCSGASRAPFRRWAALACPGEWEEVVWHGWARWIGPERGEAWRGGVMPQHGGNGDEIMYHFLSLVLGKVQGVQGRTFDDTSKMVRAKTHWIIACIELVDQCTPSARSNGRMK
jgi:hypothetical protein